MYLHHMCTMARRPISCVKETYVAKETYITGTYDVDTYDVGLFCIKKRISQAKEAYVTCKRTIHHMKKRRRVGFNRNIP